MVLYPPPPYSTLLWLVLYPPGGVKYQPPGNFWVIITATRQVVFCHEGPKPTSEARGFRSLVTKHHLACNYGVIVSHNAARTCFV